MKTYERYPKFMAWAMTLGLSLLTAGCGSGGGADPILGSGGSPPQVAPLVAPTVTATAPLDSTPAVTGVAINSSITAAFSEAMNAATITAASTFTLACPSGLPIAGTVTYSAASQAAIFTPSAPLPALTVCTAALSTAAQNLLGVPMSADYVWQFTTSATSDTTRPTVTRTVPADTATDVATNTKITAQFSEEMDPATFSASSFTLTGPGTTSVAGSVSYSVGTQTAFFTPATVLASNTLFTATITTAAKDLAANALASAKVWTFTTGTLTDNDAPTVTLVNPVNRANNVAINSVVNATFSEAMDASTITKQSFILQVNSPTLGAALLGTVSYNADSHIASFKPINNLVANTEYRATVSTLSKDLAGNALASNKVWTFTTSITGQTSPTVDLQSVAPFGAMGGAGVTSCGLTLINGDVSTTGASTTITGLTDGNGLGDPYTVAGCPGIVNGKIYTAPPAPGDASSLAIAQQSEMDAQTAFDATSTASMPGATVQTQELGGLTLAPGIYWSGTSFDITTVDLTLDAQGDANAVWVFQTDSTLTVGSNVNVILTNGAQAKNVFWHVSSAATINSDAFMQGTILAFSGVSMGTGARLDGRAISLVGGPVTLLENLINVPAP